MRTTSYCATVLLFSLFLSQRVSSSLGPKNNSPPAADQPPSPPPLPSNKENHIAGGGNLVDSCMDTQQEKGEAGMEQPSVSMDDAAPTASKAGADVDTAPTSVAGLDDEEEDEEDSRSSSGAHEGSIPERYIVGCGGDRVEAARR